MNLTWFFWQTFVNYLKSFPLLFPLVTIVQKLYATQMCVIDDDDEEENETEGACQEK